MRHLQLPESPKHTVQSRGSDETTGEAGRDSTGWCVWPVCSTDRKKAGFMQTDLHKIYSKWGLGVNADGFTTNWRGKTGLGQVTGDQCGQTAGVWSSRWEDSGLWAECRLATPSLRQTLTDRGRQTYNKEEGEKTQEKQGEIDKALQILTAQGLENSPSFHHAVCSKSTKTDFGGITVLTLSQQQIL